LLTEHQQFLTLNLAKADGCVVIFTNNHNIGCLSRQKWNGNIATASYE
jgi:hypothetical protein